MNDNTTSNDVWYYASEGTAFGPFNRAELQQKAAQGSITPETLIVPQGQEEWRAYKNAFASPIANATPKQGKPVSEMSLGELVESEFKKDMNRLKMTGMVLWHMGWVCLGLIVLLFLLLAIYDLIFG